MGPFIHCAQLNLARNEQFGLDKFCCPNKLNSFPAAGKRFMFRLTHLLLLANGSTPAHPLQGGKQLPPPIRPVNVCSARDVNHEEAGHYKANKGRSVAPTHIMGSPLI